MFRPGDCADLNRCHHLHHHQHPLTLTLHYLNLHQPLPLPESYHHSPLSFLKFSYDVIPRKARTTESPGWWCTEANYGGSYQEKPIVCFVYLFYFTYLLFFFLVLHFTVTPLPKTPFVTLLFLNHTYTTPSFPLLFILTPVFFFWGGGLQTAPSCFLSWPPP